MANPTNSIDIHDKDYATTHALLLTKKQDKAGRESTPAQQQTICGEYWGDFNDDEFLAIRQQGLIPIRYTDATGDATPSPQTVRALPDGTATIVELRGWGKVGANDMVYRHTRRRYERNGATILTSIEVDTGNVYSAGGTLTTADITLGLSGSNVQITVTGEAATTIAWQLYTSFMEAYTP